jgi:hypothetical protein
MYKQNEEKNSSPVKHERQAARPRYDGYDARIGNRQNVSITLPSHSALARIMSKSKIVKQYLDIKFRMRQSSTAWRV